MNDEDGPDLAQAVYGNFFAPASLVRQMESACPPGGILSEIPYHLDHMAQQMRDRGLPPHRWALFVHFGF